MPKNVEKVVAYITREKFGKMEVLVFAHRDFPEAGIQVPAGTVDPDEDIESAALREVQEECGLTFNKVNNYLGRFEWFRADRNELHFRNVFQICAPSTSTDEWLHIVSGHGEDHRLVFRYYWMQLVEAQKILAADQGAYLHQLQNKVPIPDLS